MVENPGKTCGATISTEGNEVGGRKAINPVFVLKLQYKMSTNNGFLINHTSILKTNYVIQGGEKM